MTSPHADRWAEVDGYLADLLLPPDAVLDEVLRSTAGALPLHHVSPLQGKLLHLLARLTRATRILELGTLGAYSTIWLARALPPGGRLVTIEALSLHAAFARENLTRAGLADVVDLRVGPALDVLPLLAAEGQDPFDLVFIDADKPNNPAYVEWALRLSRPGALLVLDNVVRDGAVVDAGSADPRVQGVRRSLELLAADPRVDATALQTVGQKGWDGFALALVREAPAT